MGNAFKKRHEPTPTQQAEQPHQAHISDQDRAILQLKVQKDRLHKYTIKIEIVIKREVEIARELLKSNKKSNALLALKRKRYQENLLSQTERQMLNLEQLVHHIQFATVQSQVFEALKHGNAVLTALNAETALEDVEQLMDESREAIDYQQQVSKLLGTELNQQDEQDVENMIRAWEEEELAGTISQLPSAPSKVPTLTDAPVTTDAASSSHVVSSNQASNKKELILS